MPIKQLRNRAPGFVISKACGNEEREYTCSCKKLNCINKNESQDMLIHKLIHEHMILEFYLNVLV